MLRSCKKLWNRILDCRVLRTGSSLALGSLLLLASCHSVPPGGFHFEDSTTVFRAAKGKLIDDVLVFPVANIDGAHLSEASLQRMTASLGRGLIRSRYSVLSKAAVDSVVPKEERRTRAAGRRAALAAAKKLEADAVLILWISTWDEYALDTLGRIQARGEFQLLAKDGTEYWKGRFSCREKVTEEPGSVPPTREARRGHAIDRVMELFVGKLPKHQN